MNIVGKIISAVKICNYPGRSRVARLVMYNTNTYLYKEYYVRIPIITDVITDFLVCAYILCITIFLIIIWASGNFLKMIYIQFKYQLIGKISRLCINTGTCSRTFKANSIIWEHACHEQAFRAWHDCTHAQRFSVVLVE